MNAEILGSGRALRDHGFYPTSPLAPMPPSYRSDRRSALACAHDLVLRCRHRGTIGVETMPQLAIVSTNAALSTASKI